MNFLVEFVRFARLHTVVGTTLSIVVLYLLAQSLAGFAELRLDLLAWTLLSCLAANIYIVGLNQITDVAIDRINKPYLPLASGAFSMRTGYWLVGGSLLLSLLIAAWIGGYLLLTVLLSLLLGTLYSLPPVRLKRFYFWAAFCILAVRGLIVNLLLYLHFQGHFTELTGIPGMVWWLTATILIYSVIIAWYKDMPDTAGDAEFFIRTLSLRIGVKTVFRLGNTLLMLTFFLLILLPFLVPTPVNKWVLSTAHLLFWGLLIAANQRVDLQKPGSIFQYYQFIWVLYFLEYIAFGIAGLSS